MNHFTEALGLSRYTLYMQDYNRIFVFSRSPLYVQSVHNAG